MGIIVSQTRFGFPAPQPAAMAKAITDICGLQVGYSDCEHKLDLHEFSGWLFWEKFPGEKVEVYAYKPGAVQKYHESLDLPDGVAMVRPQGYQDKDGVQRVYMETHVGRELTLLRVAELALKRLGGIFEDGYTADATFDRRLTGDEMQARLQANIVFHRKRTPLYALAGVLLAVSLPFHAAWAVISMPFKLRRIYKKYPGLRRPK